MNRLDFDHLFLACGVGGPLILDIERPENHLIRSVTLDFPFATIGRTSTNDIVLEQNDVSRRHAYIQFIHGRLFCFDFKSRTGTHWDSGSGAGWVGDDDRIRIGKYVLRLRPFERQAESSWPGPTELEDPLHSITADQDPLPRLALQFVKGVREKSVWEMERVLVLVGSARQCKVQLVDPRVSRFHCSILRTPLGAWVFDLLGRGGIRVNGEHLRFTRLCDGDELKVGRVKARVTCPTTPRTATVLHDSTYDDIETLEPIPQSPDDDSDLTTPGSESGMVLPLVPIRSAGQSLPISANKYSSMLPAPRMTTALRASDQETLINTLLYHFGQVQQQMADQFNQALMTMVQMFSTIHRDQMSLVRAELDRLHVLNQEIAAIQSELSRQHRLSLMRSEAEPGAMPKSEPAAAERLSDANGVQANPQAAPNAGFATGGEKLQPSWTPSAPSETAAPAGEFGFAGPAATVAAAAGPTQPERPAGGPIGGSPPAGEDVHVWLCQRMEMIRTEQQSLWQKILSTVRSTVSGNP